MLTAEQRQTLRLRVSDERRRQTGGKRDTGRDIACVLGGAEVQERWAALDTVLERMAAEMTAEEKRANLYDGLNAEDRAALSYRLRNGDPEVQAELLDALHPPEPVSEEPYAIESWPPAAPAGPLCKGRLNLGVRWSAPCTHPATRGEYCGFHDPATVEMRRERARERWRRARLVERPGTNPDLSTPDESAALGSERVVGGGGYEPDESRDSKDEQGNRRSTLAEMREEMLATRVSPSLLEEAA